MNIGKLIVDTAWIVLLGGAVYFVYLSNPRQRIAVLLALLFPGLGHLFIKQRRRGLFFLGTILGLFLAGMLLADFRNISPLDRHPIWGIAQLPGGLMTAFAALATNSLEITRESPYYAIGCLYSGTACLLNILAACDVWDLTEDLAQRKKREAQAK
jgi:hypothetical protein